VKGKVCAHLLCATEHAIIILVVYCQLCMSNCQLSHDLTTIWQLPIYTAWWHDVASESVQYHLGPLSQLSQSSCYQL